MVEDGQSMAILAYVGYYFFCTTQVFMLGQGIALFFSGLTSPKSTLSQLSYSLMSTAVTVLQYFIIGYSLHHSNSERESGHNWLVGDLRHMFWNGVMDTDEAPVIALGRALLSLGIATVPSALVASSATQRARLIPLLVFLFVWLTLVYCPVAYWCWNPQGWSYRIGALDYAGGTSIHCTAGFTALVYSLVLGPRISYGSSSMGSANDQPYSLVNVVLGTAFMWVGWIGFNGGASLAPTTKALYSVMNTQLSASAGGFTWMILDHWFSGQWSIVSFCSGVAAGLVSVTPGAGYVPLWSALIFGVVGGLTCNLGTNIKFRLKVDDPLDVFAVHGVGGLVGSVLTGIFADPQWTPHKGLMYGGWMQPLIQLGSTLAIVFYALGTALMILMVIDSFPCLSLRLTAEQEAIGVDLAENGESAAIGIANVSQNNYFSSSNDSGNSYPQDGGLRLRQTHLNSSMNPMFVESPLLQRLPASYGALSGQRHSAHSDLGSGSDVFEDHAYTSAAPSAPSAPSSSQYP